MHRVVIDLDKKLQVFRKDDDCSKSEAAQKYATLQRNKPSEVNIRKGPT